MFDWIDKGLLKTIPDVTAMYGPLHQGCQVCLCASCLYFYHNREGECLEGCEGCYVCGKKNHICGCGSYEPLKEEEHAE